MKLTALTIMLFCGISCESGATTPPRSPSYCGPRLCLEIPDTFGDAAITTNFNTMKGGDKSEIKVDGRLGITTINVKAMEGERNCEASKALSLIESEQGMFGESFVEGPDKSRCMHISFEFVRSAEGKNSLDQAPISAIWVVDDVPSTFWKKGYALRLGPQLDVKLFRSVGDSVQL